MTSCTTLLISPITARASPLLTRDHKLFRLVPTVTVSMSSHCSSAICVMVLGTDDADAAAPTPAVVPSPGSHKI